jgi:hypothetical protein
MTCGPHFHREREKVETYSDKWVPGNFAKIPRFYNQHVVCVLEQAIICHVGL